MTRAQGTLLVTGAAGALGRLLVERLPAAGWAVRGFARSPHEGDWVIGSVTDLDALVAAMDGVDAVFHLAGLSTPGSPWSDYLHTNIDGTHNVLEAARRIGVRKVIVASSNHAVGYTRRTAGEVAGDATPRPDSFYGVSKVAMEALGSFFADEYGLSVASVRIGSCFERPTSARMLESWLSPGDFVRLTEALLRAEWDGHRMLWGVSRNTRRWFSLAEAEALGYAPLDDAEAYADEVAGASSEYVGGSAPPALAAPPA